MAWGTPTSIGSVAGNVGTSLILTTTAAVPAGALIVVAVAETVAASAAIGAVTDSASNTYATANTAIGSTSRRYAIKYAYNVTALASGQTITLAKGNNNDAIISACYVTGELITSDPLDNTVNANATGTSTTPSVTSAAPAQSGEIFFAMIRLLAVSTDVLTQDTGGGWAFPPGYLRTTGASSQLAIGGGYIVNAGSSAETWAPTLNNSRQWDTLVTAFKVAPATGGAAVGMTRPFLFGPTRGPSKGLTPTQAYPRLPYLFSVTAEPGAYATSGVAQAFNIALHLIAAMGTYALTGVAAILAAVLHGITLVAAVGAYVLAGQGSLGTKTKLLAAAAGTYALTGVQALARYTRASAVGAYTLAGVAATKAVARATAVGAYVLTGVEATRAIRRLSSAGAYVYSGSIATLAKSGVFLYTLTAAAGSYVLAGKTTVLSWLNPVVNPRATQRKVQPKLVKARTNSPALTLARSVKATLLKIGGRRRLDD